ncbi:MAG TPA: hypothetical protein VH475_13305 [Tepidisphaeraceae bacterium]
MVRYVIRPLVVLCVILCFTIPLAMLAGRSAGVSKIEVHRSAGSSTVVYFDSQIHVRRIGYSPEIDGDEPLAVPAVLVPLTVPPIGWWLRARRRGPGERSSGRWFRRCCAACPLMVMLGMVANDPEAFLFCFLPLAAVLAGVWGVHLFATRYRYRTRSQRRIEAGLCAKCGYDMRATPIRCPECGAFAAHPLERVAR